MMIPAVDRLIKKLDEIVFGEARPMSTSLAPTEATGERDEQLPQQEGHLRRSSAQRFDSSACEQPPQHYEEQETLENERYGSNNFETTTTDRSSASPELLYRLVR